jgi:hypothetical protein
MKIHLIALIFLGITNFLKAQSFEVPMDWASSNRYSVGNGAGTTVTKSSGSHSGLYAARLEGKYSNTLMLNVPGMLCTGMLNGLNASGGLAYTLRSQKLKGYYMYSPVGADKAAIQVLLSKWNASTHKKDTIAFGNLTLGSAVSYSLFEIPLSYTSNAIPDSQLVVISSSQNRLNAVAGSTLLIDDVMFDGTFTGTSTHGNAVHSLIYPSPASAAFTIRPVAMLEKIIIINFLGAEVYSSKAILSDQEIKINTGLSEGLYLIHLFYKSGTEEIIPFVRAD